MEFPAHMGDKVILEGIPLSDVTLDGSKAHGKSLMEPQNGLYMIILSALFFHLVNRVVSYMDAPKAVKSKEEQWKWRNVCVSWFHALTAGMCSLLLMYYHPDLLEDLFTYKRTAGYVLCAFSTGYFCYDFFDILYEVGFLAHWEVCIHHLPVCAGMIYNVVGDGYIGYHVMVLTLEVNSIFLHGRKVMHMTRRYPPDCWQYRIVVAFNMASFVIFRFGSLALVYRGLWLHFYDIPLGFYSFLLFGNTLVSLINCGLFWQLIKGDYLRKHKKLRAISPDCQDDKKCIRCDKNSNDCTSKPHFNGDVRSRNQGHFDSLDAIQKLDDDDNDDSDDDSVPDDGANEKWDLVL